MVMLTYGFGVGLAGLAGVLAAPTAQVGPLMGSNLIIVGGADLGFVEETLGGHAKAYYFIFSRRADGTFPRPAAGPGRRCPGGNARLRKRRGGRRRSASRPSAQRPRASVRRSKE
jgi:hypothetical protein